MSIDIEKIPNDSNITIESKGNELIIILPYRKSNGNDIFCNGIYIISSLLMIILILGSVSDMIHSSNISGDKWFWLLLTVLVGFLGVWQLYTIFRKIVDEKIILKPKELFFDSGVSPLYCAEKQDTLMRYSFTTRYQKTFSLQELDSLVLTKTKDNSLYLLTFEKSEKSIFLAYRMRSDEKKWLYRTILKYYSLEGSFQVMKMDESRPRKKKIFILAWIVIFVFFLNMIK